MYTLQRALNYVDDGPGTPFSYCLEVAQVRRVSTLLPSQRRSCGAVTGRIPYTIVSATNIALKMLAYLKENVPLNIRDRERECGAVSSWEPPPILLVECATDLTDRLSSKVAQLAAPRHQDTHKLHCNCVISSWISEDLFLKFLFVFVIIPSLKKYVIYIELMP